MNRLDRLFAITTTLQLKGTVRASDLAATFEVSTRTIYRDIGALSEAGVPVVSLPGQGYALSEGFFLPPLIFTPGEAAAIALGTRMLASQATGHHVAEAEQALEKIAAVLPLDVRQRVDRLSGIITIPFPQRRFDLDDPRLGKLQDAILDHRVVELRYHSRSGNEITEREVEPRELSYYDRTWFLTGYCRLRQDVRSFRVERIAAITLTDEHFTPTALPERESRTIEVRVRFTESFAPWVRERQHWAFQREEQDAKGVIMTYAPGSLDGIAGWIFGWGTDAEPLSPPELRELIKREAQAVAERLT